MINAEELNEFLRRKKNICVSHIACKDCPLLSDRGGGYCAANSGEVTQGQIDTVMTFEPPIDWGSVAVDTPILVRDMKRNVWLRRYFAGYENGVVYVWADGATSWSANGQKQLWKNAKLAVEDER